MSKVIPDILFLVVTASLCCMHPTDCSIYDISSMWCLEKECYILFVLIFSMTMHTVGGLWCYALSKGKVMILGGTET